MFLPVPTQVLMSFSAGDSWYCGLHEQATHPINQMFAIAIEKLSVPHAFYYIERDYCRKLHVTLRAISHQTPDSLYLKSLTSPRNYITYGWVGGGNQAHADLEVFVFLHP